MAPRASNSTSDKNFCVTTFERETDEAVEAEPKKIGRKVMTFDKIEDCFEPLLKFVNDDLLA
jgi:hypothetical protein